MAIKIQCQCGTSLKVNDDVAGKRLKCPQCGSAIDVPGLPARLEPSVFRTTPVGVRIDNLERNDRETAKVIERLQRTQRRLTVALGVFVGLLFVLSVAAVFLPRPAPLLPSEFPPQPERWVGSEVVAHRFFVTDERGNSRGTFGMSGEGGTGSPWLELDDSKGRRAVVITLNDDLPVVAIYRGGAPAVTLAGLEDGTNGILVYDADYNGRIFLSTRSDGYARVRVMGKGSRGGVNLAAHLDGNPQVSVLDKDDEVRAGLTILPDEMATLVMRAADAPAGVVLGVAKDGLSYFGATGRDGKAIEPNKPRAPERLAVTPTAARPTDPAKPILGADKARAAAPKYSLRAENLLAVARGLEKSRKTTSALSVYRQVLQEYPGTEQAIRAADRLRILGKK